MAQSLESLPFRMGTDPHLCGGVAFSQGDSVARDGFVIHRHREWHAHLICAGVSPPDSGACATAQSVIKPMYQNSIDPLPSQALGAHDSQDTNNMIASA